MTISTQPSRFYDAESGGELQLQLQPVGAEFKILRRFGYRDPHAEVVLADRGDRHAVGDRRPGHGGHP